jgi:Flp pilus assembly pilin Flp
MEFVKSFVREEEGQDVLEYGLMLGLVALIAYGAVNLVGQDVSTIWTNVQSKADDAATLVTP